MHSWYQGVLKDRLTHCGHSLDAVFRLTADRSNPLFALKRSTFENGRAFNPVGYKIGLELMIKCRCERVVEVPIQHYPRTSGRQTGANLRVVFRAFSELLAFKAEMRKVEKAA